LFHINYFTSDLKETNNVIFNAIPNISIRRCNCVGSTDVHLIAYVKTNQVLSVSRAQE